MSMHKWKEQRLQKWASFAAHTFSTFQSRGAKVSEGKTFTRQLFDSLIIEWKRCNGSDWSTMSAWFKWTNRFMNSFMWPPWKPIPKQFCSSVWHVVTWSHVGFTQEHLLQYRTRITRYLFQESTWKTTKGTCPSTSFFSSQYLCVGIWHSGLVMLVQEAFAIGYNQRKSDSVPVH